MPQPLPVLKTVECFICNARDVSDSLVLFLFIIIVLYLYLANFSDTSKSILHSATAYFHDRKYNMHHKISRQFFIINCYENMFERRLRVV